VDRFTFADSVTGLEHALVVTLSLRRAGFKTRLVTSTLAGFTLHTVVSTPPKRPNRKARGAEL
jgi:hypothetical protein